MITWKRLAEIIEASSYRELGESGYVGCRKIDADELLQLVKAEAAEESWQEKKAKVHERAPSATPEQKLPRSGSGALR